MRRLWKELNSQLRYQIIFPFMLLTLIVAVAGGLVVFFLLGQSLRERFDNQLATVTRAANDALITQEEANLQFLREVSFAQANASSGAPAVADALHNQDAEGLARALDPFFRVGASRSGVRLDRMIAFDRSGQTLTDFERPVDIINDRYVTHSSFDISDAWFTDLILNRASDELGDKYAGMIAFSDTNTIYFVTVAPVYRGDDIVGGVLAAMRLDSMLTMLRDRSQAAAMTLYDNSGLLLGTTLGAEVPSMSLSLLSEFAEEADKTDNPLFSAQAVGTREFQFAYVPLMIRNAPVGILAPALSSDYVITAWDSTVWPVISIIVALALAIFILGIYIARRITMPLEDLARTSMDVAAGKLDRRANVNSDNEIGQLAVSFNQMTEYLIRLYGQVQSEASQRAAIVESITDGIIVVDDQGYVQMINRATRRLMGIDDQAPTPARLSDIPMQKLVEGVPGFGSQRAQDLYTLGDYIVRASIAPVIGADNSRSGYVCLLQDMTAEVAVDRAKTNFIGTISHELKTPLTVISGNSDLLLRGLAGRLEDEQAGFVDTIRQHANNMAGLLQNVITVAHLDSGITTTELAPVDLVRPIDEANWRVQSQIKAKNIALQVQLPQELRPVLADFDHVRQIVFQLLDNARRYTSAGSITVRAVDCGNHVRVEVEDTGRGIAPDMQEQIFQRFTRGDGASEGINSAERGIGLGLAICKHLVERLGGEIGVKSVLGQGSTFYFTLRYVDDPPSPEKKNPLAVAA
jgi:signal transduction histidine kinase/HAMP domain-containing protein